MRLAVCLRAMRLAVLWLGCAAAPALAQGAPAEAGGFEAPQHTSGWPAMVPTDSQYEAQAGLAMGPELQRGRSAKAMLAEQRRLDAALAGLQPGRKGVVDAFVVSIALDSDPVFAREAREAGRVLTRRYNAAGHSITLAGTDGRAPSTLPSGSITALTLTLARVAELMDRDEDVLVLFSTSHGAPPGIAYHDGDEGFGLLTPPRLAAIFDELGIKRRVLLLSACYAGVFIPSLAGGNTAMFTAAWSESTSFGCRAENDWTFFGDALVNHALRKPQSFAAACDEAVRTIAGWERTNNLPESSPTVSIGDDARGWLAQLDAQVPKAATAPVGAPATDALKPDR